MKLPWISRSAHEATIAIYEGIVAHERAKQRESGERFTEWFHGQKALYADLLAKYHALKVQGASEPLPPTAPVPKPRPDLIKAAITRKAGRNKQLRRNMEAQVVLDRAAGMDDATIAARIDAGISGDEANVV